MGLDNSNAVAPVGAFDINATYDQPIYPETVTRDIATQGAATQTDAGNGSWTDFFKSLAQTAVGYSIQKDAAETSARLGGRPVGSMTAQPGRAYAPATQPQGISQGGLLLLIALGVAFAVADKK